MKIFKILSLSIILGAFLLTGCTHNDSSKSQGSEVSEKSGNENPSDLPWIG